MHSRPSTTGAAWTWLVVNSAAAVAGRSQTMSARSFFLFLIPQATPANLNPGIVIVFVLVIRDRFRLVLVVRDRFI